MIVVVLGASSDPNRYSYRAMVDLEGNGHSAIPVHPRESMILGKKVFHDLSDLSGTNVHTVTVYLNKSLSDKLADKILALKPKRVIFNPGAENEELSAKLKESGIEVENACTLVLLRTGQF